MAIVIMVRYFEFVTIVITADGDEESSVTEKLELFFIFFLRRIRADLHRGPLRDEATGITIRKGSK